MRIGNCQLLISEVDHSQFTILWLWSQRYARMSVEVSAMKTQPRDRIIDLFVQQMREELGAHLKQVILFGSRARGDAAPDSDYDFLAIVDDATPLIVGQIDEVAGEILFQHNAVLSIFPVSEKRFKAQTFNPFLQNVKKEGIVL